MAEKETFKEGLIYGAIPNWASRVYFFKVLKRTPSGVRVVEVLPDIEKDQGDGRQGYYIYKGTYTLLNESFWIKDQERGDFKKFDPYFEQWDEGEGVRIMRGAMFLVAGQYPLSRGVFYHYDYLD